MRDLRDEAKETVLIGTIIGAQEGVVLEQVLGSHEIKFAIDVGHRYYLHTAAPGKAMLAFLPQEGQQRAVEALAFQRFNRKTITNRKAMFKVLQKARQDGYAVDTAERIEGLHGVACPILNYLGYPVAAVWITGPAHRMPQSDFGRLGGHREGACPADFPQVGLLAAGRGAVLMACRGSGIGGRRSGGRKLAFRSMKGEKP